MRRIGCVTLFLFWLYLLPAQDRVTLSGDVSDSLSKETLLNREAKIFSVLGILSRAKKLEELDTNHDFQDLLIKRPSHTVAKYKILYMNCQAKALSFFFWLRTTLSKVKLHFLTARALASLVVLRMLVVFEPLM